MKRTRLNLAVLRSTLRSQASEAAPTLTQLLSAPGDASLSRRELLGLAGVAAVSMPPMVKRVAPARSISASSAGGVLPARHISDGLGTQHRPPRAIPRKVKHTGTAKLLLWPCHLQGKISALEVSTPTWREYKHERRGLKDTGWY